MVNDYWRTKMIPSKRIRLSTRRGSKASLKIMPKKKTPVRVDPKRPKRKRRRGKGKSIKKPTPRES
jgi:hypothetical protein